MIDEEWGKLDNAYEIRRQLREERANNVQQELVKLLCDSQADGVAVIVSALEEAAGHYDNCCDPHAEAALLDIVDRINGSNRDE